ncbi:MAG: hypothetical protein HFI76_11845 [Lachnospiraceae bacterium]|jgi:hypothetical protein|nr:hypothetical protein [Lachnospiraceae bacterium]
MARTSMKIVYKCTFEQAQNKVTNILSGKGFKTTTIKTGETVWKKGTGLMTAMQFIKVDYSEKEILLSAWIQAGVGSMGGGEMDLSGIVGALPKKQLMKVLEEMKRAFG